MLKFPGKGADPLAPLLLFSELTKVVMVEPLITEFWFSDILFVWLDKEFRILPISTVPEEDEEDKEDEDEDEDDWVYWLLKLPPFSDWRKILTPLIVILTFSYHTEPSESLTLTLTL